MIRRYRKIDDEGEEGKMAGRKADTCIYARLILRTYTMRLIIRNVDAPMTDSSTNYVGPIFFPVKAFIAMCFGFRFNFPNVASIANSAVKSIKLGVSRKNIISSCLSRYEERVISGRFGAATFTTC